MEAAAVVEAAVWAAVVVEAVEAVEAVEECSIRVRSLS